MNRWKAIGARLLKPGLLWVILLTILCVPVLIYVLSHGIRKSAVAYAAYLASAYMLTVWVLRIPGLVRRIKAAVYRCHLPRRYLTDLSFRAQISLHASTVVNMGYALFKLYAGIAYQSFWFGAAAVYYLILAVARGLLLRSTYKKGACIQQEFRTARSCGYLLFLLNIALSAVTVQMVFHGKGYSYPGYLIFVVALYAFYSVTFSIVNLIRFRKLKSPVLSASKVLGVAAALVSMLSLQTAMFASFGGGADFQRLMNALTGGAVCLLIFLMAILMIVRASRELQKTKTGNPPFYQEREGTQNGAE